VPPCSPQKEVNNFDYLMGFAGDDEIAGPVLPEGPVALKIKVKAKRYENSVSISLGGASKKKLIICRITPSRPGS
jgi:hypothetical protein